MPRILDMPTRAMARVGRGIAPTAGRAGPPHEAPLFFTGVSRLSLNNAVELAICRFPAVFFKSLPRQLFTQKVRLETHVVRSNCVFQVYSER